MQKDEIFVAAISQKIFETTMEHYKRSLFNATESRGMFGGVKRILDKLDEHDKEVLFRFLQVVAFDAVSPLFANLDGTSFSLGLKGDFSLLYEGVEIQGDLQDLLVSEAESRKLFDTV